jgi:hypothetical protein
LLLACRWAARPTDNLPAAIGCCVGLAVLTRYVGVTLLPPFLLCFIALSTSAGDKLRNALAFLVPATAPIGVWLLAVRAVDHTQDRAAAFHPPHGAAVALLAPVVLCIALLPRSFSRLRMRERTDGDLIALWCAAFLAAYCGAVLLSLSLFDALTPLDARILSPALVFGGLLLVRTIWTIAPNGDTNGPASAEQDRAGSRPPIRRIAASVALVAAYSRGGAALTLARRLHDSGYGYTSRAWRGSPTLAWAAAAPRGAVLYSNSPELIAFCTDRQALPLPTLYSPTTLLPNRDLPRDVVALREALRRGAIVVYFPDNPRSYLLSSADIERTCACAPALRFADGIVYRKASTE